MEEVIISTLGPDPRNEAACQPSRYIFVSKITRFKFPQKAVVSKYVVQRSNSCYRSARDVKGKHCYDSVFSLYVNFVQGFKIKYNTI